MNKMSALSQTRRFSDVRATSVLIATNPLFTSHCLGSATDYCLASVWECLWKGYCIRRRRHHYCFILPLQYHRRAARPRRERGSQRAGGTI